MDVPDVEELVMEAEAKWSAGDDEGAAATLERALALVWGRPDQVWRVSETATKLADARPSEALRRVAQRAGEGAEALEATGPESDLPDVEEKPTDRRRRLGLVQIVVFSVVVLVVLTVQFLDATR